MAAIPGQQLQAVPGNTKAAISVALTGVSLTGQAGFVAAPIKIPEIEWLIVQKRKPLTAAEVAANRTVIEARTDQVTAEATRVNLYIEDEI